MNFRICLLSCFFVVPFCLPGIVQAQGGGDFSSWFGGTLLGPTSTDLDLVIDGFWIGDEFELIGSEGGQAASQRYTLSGNSDPITLFDSLDSATGPGGDTTGVLRDAIQTPSGVLYVGQSAGLFDLAQSTSWENHSDPMGGVASTGGQVSGAWVAVGDNGVFVGSTGVASYGTHGNLPENLPGGFFANVATDISHDSEFIAGDFLWEKSGFGGYAVTDTSGFDFSVSQAEPTWIGVETAEDGSVYYAGEFFDTNTFENSVGFWDGDGAFLGSAGNRLADFAVIRGDVVAAVNGADDGMLVRLNDFDLLSIETLLGSKATFVDPGAFGSDGGLFAKEGALGFVLENNTGTFTTVVSTAPEPSTAAVLLFSTVTLLTRRRRRQKRTRANTAS